MNKLLLCAVIGVLYMWYMVWPMHTRAYNAAAEYGVLETAPELYDVLSAGSLSIAVMGQGSGANMAHQMHVAFSSEIGGAGLVGASPYGCSNHNYFTMMNRCMYGMESINTEALAFGAKQQAGSQRADWTKNLAWSKVFQVEATSDAMVATGIMTNATRDVYTNLGVPSASITTESVAAPHGWITNESPEGYSVCECESTDPLCTVFDCDYSTTEKVVNNLWPELTKNSTPDTSLSQNYRFNQDTFCGWVRWEEKCVDTIGMSQYGYIYIPTKCHSEKCNLLVHFHGCGQQLVTSSYEDGIYTDGSDTFKQANFMHTTEVTKVADEYGFMVLFPQIDAYNMAFKNDYSCWDWWGYSGAHYHTSVGVQMLSVKYMIDTAIWYY